MAKYPQFTLAFNIGPSNKERLEAFELYREAFHAKKLSEAAPPDGGDLHIMMEIYGLKILIAPGSPSPVCPESLLNCEVRFDNEAEFRAAYDAISKDAKSHVLEGPYPWTKLFGLVVDKFGIGWALYYE